MCALQFQMKCQKFKDKARKKFGLNTFRWKYSENYNLRRSVANYRTFSRESETILQIFRSVSRAR